MRRGAWFPTFCSNSALWSLSYEWWFYVGFALLCVRRGHPGPRAQRRIVAAVALAGTASYLVYPSPPGLFASYFAIWWTGLEICRQYLDEGRVSFRGQRFALLLQATCTAIWLLPAVRALLAGTYVSPGLEPFGQVRHFGAALVICVTGIGLCERADTSRLRRLGAAPFTMFRWLAPVSYALYATHNPILYWLICLKPGRMLLCLVGTLASLLVAYVLEIVLQPRIAAYFPQPQSLPPAPLVEAKAEVAVEAGAVYERFGFALHSIVQKGSWSFARDELARQIASAPAGHSGSGAPLTYNACKTGAHLAPAEPGNERGNATNGLRTQWIFERRTEA
ncbi:acyltransferase family protein [Cupriavidus necator]